MGQEDVEGHDHVRPEGTLHRKEKYSSIQSENFRCFPWCHDYYNLDGVFLTEIGVCMLLIGYILNLVFLIFCDWLGFV